MGLEHWGHTVTSTENTCRSSQAHGRRSLGTPVSSAFAEPSNNDSCSTPTGAAGGFGEAAPAERRADATTCFRSVAFGASAPWKRILGNHGGGTLAQSLAISSSGSKSTNRVPSRHGFFIIVAHLPIGELHEPVLGRAKPWIAYSDGRDGSFRSDATAQSGVTWTGA